MHRIPPHHEIKGARTWARDQLFFFLLNFYIFIFEHQVSEMLLQA